MGRPVVGKAVMPVNGIWAEVPDDTVALAEAPVSPEILEIWVEAAIPVAKLSTVSVVVGKGLVIVP